MPFWPVGAGRRSRNRFPRWLRSDRSGLWVRTLTATGEAFDRLPPRDATAANHSKGRLPSLAPKGCSTLRRVKAWQASPLAKTALLCWKLDHGVPKHWAAVALRARGFGSSKHPGPRAQVAAGPCTLWFRAKAVGPALRAARALVAERPKGPSMPYQSLLWLRRRQGAALAALWVQPTPPAASPAGWACPELLREPGRSSKALAPL